VITSSNYFTAAQRAACISTYFNGSEYVGIQASDLNTAALPPAITNDPAGSISQVSKPFTIPSNFFGVHCQASSTPALASSGASTVRTRDCFVNWNELIQNVIPNSAGTTSLSFTAGSTNTVNWASHGLASASNGVWFSSSGGPLPASLTANQIYYIVNVTSNTFQVSLTPNGSPISLGTSGSGVMYGWGTILSAMNPLASNGTLDLIVNAATAGNMDILFDCSEPPSMITADGTSFNRPATINYILQWFQTLYKYYPHIKYFETWNEPNDPGYFNGTMSGTTSTGYGGGASTGNDLYLYAAWMTLAINNASAAWGAKVVSPSWTGFSGVAQMQAWLSTAGTPGTAQCSILAFHPYGGGNSYARFDVTTFNAYLSMIKSNNPNNSQIWVTEVGDTVVSQTILWRAHLYAAANGIARMFWYNYDIGVGTYNVVGSSGMQINDPLLYVFGGPTYNVYPGLSTSYHAMISTLKGGSAAYLNYSSGYRAGAQVNSVTYLM